MGLFLIALKSSWRYIPLRPLSLDMWYPVWQRVVMLRRVVPGGRANVNVRFIQAKFTLTFLHDD